MVKKKVFVDSDVVISSLISTTGAAHFLLNETDLEFFISNKSVEELVKVSEKLGLDQNKLKILIKNRLKMVSLQETIATIKKDLAKFVTDSNDAHIVAGAKKAKARFLISYNIRHFKVDQVKAELNILITTPANFLQYLRSVE